MADPTETAPSSPPDPAAPRGLRALTPSSQKLYRQLVREYSIRDGGGQAVLLSGLRSLDLAEEAEGRVRADGPVQVDRFGQRKAHPLLSTARDFRAQWVGALRQLALGSAEGREDGR